MKKIFFILDSITEFVSDIVIIALIIIAALQIFFRYVIGHALSWTEEVSLMLFLWLAYFGMVTAMRKEAHLRVDAFIMVLPKRVQHWLHLAALLGAVIGCTFITWVSFETVLKIMSRGQTAISVDLPIWTVWLAIPICFALSALQALRHFINTLTGKDI